MPSSRGSSGGGGGGGGVCQRIQPLKSVTERKQRHNDAASAIPSSSTTSTVAVVSVNKSTGKRHWCTRRDGDWNCSTCSKLNYEEDEKCIICGRQKQQLAPAALIRKDSLTLDLEALSLRKATEAKGTSASSNSLYSKDEKKQQQDMDKIQNDYRNFIQTKLRLDRYK